MPRGIISASRFGMSRSPVSTDVKNDGCDTLARASSASRRVSSSSLPKAVLKSTKGKILSCSKTSPGASRILIPARAPSNGGSSAAFVVDEELSAWPWSEIELFCTAAFGSRDKSSCIVVSSVMGPSFPDEFVLGSDRSFPGEGLLENC